MNSTLNPCYGSSLAHDLQTKPLTTMHFVAVRARTASPTNPPILSLIKPTVSTLHLFRSSPHPFSSVSFVPPYVIHIETGWPMCALSAEVTCGGSDVVAVRGH